jgi:hypothetical protein
MSGIEAIHRKLGLRAVYDLSAGHYEHGHVQLGRAISSATFY